MYIYLCSYVLLILIGTLLLNPGRMMRERRLIFCIFASVQWIFLSGFRHITIGTDTEQYGRHFSKCMQCTYRDIIPNLVKWIQGYNNIEEPGYFALQVFFQIFSKNYQLWLLFVAMFFTIPLGIWIYKYSADPLMSFVIYFTLFSPFFAVTGMAQTTATAIVVFGGYRFLRRRKVISFVLICLLGALFHKSAICFLVLYAMAQISVKKIYLFLGSVAFIILFLARDIYIRFIANMVGYQDFIGTTNNSPVNFALSLLAVYLLICWRRQNILDEEKDSNIWINAILAALLLLPLVFVNASAMRGEQYFSIFLMLIVPQALKTFRLREGRVLSYMLFVALGVLFFRREPNYLFFWQV